MYIILKNNKDHMCCRVLTSLMILCITLSLILGPAPQIYAQSVLNLPAPGTMVMTSPGYIPTMIKGITFYPDNPLQLGFIVDPGNSNLSGDGLKNEVNKMVRYFLASLTVPEEELWVNLSPYESNRIIPQAFGETVMGRDLLAQDYLLKQLTASLMYPEGEIGDAFWQRVYQKTNQLFGSTDIPINTFNKIWIVPEKAVVLEHENRAFVVDSYLKVMLEEDYLALKSNLNNSKYGMDELAQSDIEDVSKITSDIVRDVLIPEIEKEVNRGKNFANLRQIYNAMILATWYKGRLKDGLLGQVYVDQNKIKGIDLEDKQVKQKIYDQYIEAFRQGAYNYIKEEYDPISQEVIPRKYFSGGFLGEKLKSVVQALTFSAALLLPSSVQARYSESLEPTTDTPNLQFIVALLDIGPLFVGTAKLKEAGKKQEIAQPLEFPSRDTAMLVTEVEKAVFGVLNMLRGDGVERVNRYKMSRKLSKLKIKTKDGESEVRAVRNSLNKQFGADGAKMIDNVNILPGMKISELVVRVLRETHDFSTSTRYREQAKEIPSVDTAMLNSRDQLEQEKITAETEWEKIFHALDDVPAEQLTDKQLTDEIFDRNAEDLARARTKIQTIKAKIVRLDEALAGAIDSGDRAMMTQQRIIPRNQYEMLASLKDSIGDNSIGLDYNRIEIPVNEGENFAYLEVSFADNGTRIDGLKTRWPEVPPERRPQRRSERRLQVDFYPIEKRQGYGTVPEFSLIDFSLSIKPGSKPKIILIVKDESTQEYEQVMSKGSPSVDVKVISETEASTKRYDELKDILHFEPVKSEDEWLSEITEFAGEVVLQWHPDHEDTMGVTQEDINRWLDILKEEGRNADSVLQTVKGENIYEPLAGWMSKLAGSIEQYVRQGQNLDAVLNGVKSYIKLKRQYPKRKMTLKITSGGELIVDSPEVRGVGTTRKDRSMFSTPRRKAPGGIDLNPALLDLQIKRDGNGVPLPLPQQPIHTMQIEGFLPVIINVTPITNLPLLIGISDRNMGPQLSRLP